MFQSTSAQPRKVGSRLCARDRKEAASDMTNAHAGTYLAVKTFFQSEGPVHGTAVVEAAAHLLHQLDDNAACHAEHAVRQLSEQPRGSLLIPHLHHLLQNNCHLHAPSTKSLG